MIGRVVRKLNMGGAVYSAVKGLASDSVGDISPESARARLLELCPDAHGSALCERVHAEAKRKLDIIVPAYNAEKYLRRCLDSALSQKTRFDFRVIVVNDGSADSTPEILEEYRNDPRIEVITQENRGLSGARNTGLLHSEAEYVLFLDADDMLTDGAVEKMLSAAEANGAAFVEAAYNIIGSDGKHIRYVPHAGGRLTPPEGCSGFACGCVISSSLLDCLRFPPAYLFEDSVMAQILLPRAADKGCVCIGLNEPCWCYRVNPNGITQKSKASPRGIDSLWITLSLYGDRKALGLENTQSYYEYILNMLLQTFRRTEELNDAALRDIFVVWRDFILREFDGFVSLRPAFRALEDAVRSGDFGKYRLFCAVTKA